MILLTHISYNLKKSFYLLMKIIELHEVYELKYFQMKFNYFQIPFQLNKWKKSCHLLSRVLWWKEFEFTEIRNAKMKVWESPFIPSHLTFKKFRISLNFTQANRTINRNYLFNITFQNLEFWDVTNLPPLKWISSLRFREARKK